MTVSSGATAPQSQNCAVFISGRGSNLEVFLKASNKISVTLVVSNNAQALGLEKARKAGVDVLTLASPIDWSALHQELLRRNIAGLFLAGFMKIIPAVFLEKWIGRIFNIHPSLLPKYKGLHPVKRAYNAGDDVGASIHRVTPEVDSGEVLLQKVSVPSVSLSTLSLQQTETLNLDIEHQLVAQWIDEQWPSILTS